MGIFTCQAGRKFFRHGLSTQVRPGIKAAPDRGCCSNRRIMRTQPVRIAATRHMTSDINDVFGSKIQPRKGAVLLVFAGGNEDTQRATTWVRLDGDQVTRVWQDNAEQ